MPVRDARARVRETAEASYSLGGLSWFDTLHPLGWSAAGGGALAAANELREVQTYADLGMVGMGIAGVDAATEVSNDACKPPLS